MDFELYLSITLRSRSFSALVAPSDLFIQALNRNLGLQRFKVARFWQRYSEFERTCEVEEMIRSRMEKERALLDDILWPVTFCMGK
jgi:hypothetical protein